MKRDRAALDHLIVRQCLSGSETAWQELYGRFIGLMRSVVQKNAGISPEDTEDIIQLAFLELTMALKAYDFGQPLPRFICLITERVMVDEYRRRNALKRIRDVDTVEWTDMPHGVAACAAFEGGPQHELMQRAQEVRALRVALKELDPGCRRLLELRYFREFQFNEIARILGSSKNTLIVRSRRCLERLRTTFMHCHTNAQS